MSHNHNSNHFTGKTKSFQTPRRKVGKVKSIKKHNNKYAKYSLGNTPTTNN